MFSIVPLAGLGNRIRVVASAFCYCSKNNVPMRLIWLREPGFNACWNDLFQIDNLPFEINDHSILNYFVYSKPSWKNLFVSKIIDKLSKRNMIYELYKDKLDSQIVLSDTIVSSFSQQGELNDISEIFKPNVELQNKIDSLTAQFSNNTIGVHIRQTDNSQSKSTSTIEKFDNAIAKQISADSTTKFFLCSDDMSVKKYFVDKYGNNILVFNSNLSRNSPQGIKDAVIELWTLASTKEIWGSFYSSYTDMASCIFGAPLKIIT